MNTEQRPLSQALDLWRQITGFNPDSKTHNLGSWDIQQTFKALQEALELDPTEITATLLLSHFLSEHLVSKSYSLHDMVYRAAVLEAKLVPIRALQGILTSPEVVEARDQFIAAIWAALEQYQVIDRNKLEKLLARHDDVALLRRDALRSMQQLTVHQFSSGLPEAPEIKPAYARHVYQWWNLNSMLAAVPRMPAGISLNLIRHPEGFQSFFAFCIRNGGNIFIVSDVPEEEHPLQAYMSRRPDRALSDRACRNWFPYDLLDVKVDEEAGRLFFGETTVRGLVAYQSESLPLKAINELAAEEMVWLTLMFDLLVERFWNQGWQCPALSYTGEMLKPEGEAIAAAAREHLPVVQYKPLGLTELTLVDLHTEAVSEDAVGDKHDSPNAWLEERYAHKVDPTILNLVNDPSVKLSIEMSSGALGNIEKTDEFKALNHWDQQKKLSNCLGMHSFNAAAFGTREKLANDRLFIARSNYAKVIGAHAAAEFKEREKEVEKWYLDRLEANKENLIAWAGNETVWSGATSISSFGSAFNRGSFHVKTRTAPDGSKVSWHSLIQRIEGRASGLLLGTWDRARHALCALTGNRSTYSVIFSPASPEELALLTGCEVTDLPDVLQHWNLRNPYYGNSILDRIDPMIWAAKNPWLKMELQFYIPFSKRAMDKLSRNPPMPNVPGPYTELDEVSS